MHDGTLSTTYGPEYSTVFISGSPPCGIPDKQWRALGLLAAKIRAEQTAAAHGTGIPIPRDDIHRAHAPGWSITARTEDIGRIAGAAHHILQGAHEAESE